MKTVHPRLIQGGMGIGVSGWELARAVSRTGQLGTVSITGLWVVMARLLQRGDPGGHIRRALSHFPCQAIAERVLGRYFLEGGKPKGKPFQNPPMLTYPLRPHVTEMLVTSSFVDVWLSKEGHDGVVAVNGLEKIQLAHLPSLYGAMLADVDYVLMGAGIPLQISEVLDRLSEHQPVSYRLGVEGSQPGDSFEAHFSPAESVPLDSPAIALKRPFFFPIISSHVLAQMFTKHGAKKADGFIVEGPTAGGHNAPPRNRKELTPTGEPLYTERDLVDLSKMDFGLPFWLAGSYAGPDALPRAMSAGAYGIQVGSIFALCRESGLAASLKEQVVVAGLSGSLVIRTNPTSSPSGFPFKEAQLPDTLTDTDIYENRPRTCDIGCLRSLYRQSDGKVRFRCPAEPVENYVKKGGAREDTEGRRCLCNTLCATIDLGQVRPEWDDYQIEPPLVTLGDDLDFLPDLVRGQEYTAEDVVHYLMQNVPEQEAV